MRPCPYRFDVAIEIAGVLALVVGEIALFVAIIFKL